MTCSNCKCKFVASRPWAKWCSYACKRAATKPEADKRDACYWRADNRFSLPGDGGYATKKGNG